MFIEIKDFDGYEVNEEGVIRSKNRVVEHSNGVSTTKKGKVLKPHLTQNGYLFVRLSKNGKKYNKKVHRLVAETFLENPQNLPCVNHKDENKLNNNIENLEWCSIAYNNNYGTRIEKARKSISDANTKYQVVQLTKNNEFVKVWKNCYEIERELGFFATNIHKACKHKYNTAYGFKWEFISKP